MAPGDIAGVFAVRTSTRENPVSMDRLAELGINPDSIREDLARRCRGWVAIQDGGVTGFTIGDGDDGEVKVLAVLPASEGQGIGRRLMLRVQAWLFSRGHESIWLEENPDPSVRAYGFYRRLGWQATDEYRANGDRVLRLKMTDAGPD
jgi:ribosomal protein S18 acetylase RimI-like enzyme